MTLLTKKLFSMEQLTTTLAPELRAHKATCDLFVVAQES